MPLHLCTACCLVPPARTNGAKYLRRLEPQACCARPSAGRHYDLTEIDLWCCASITHPSDMDQPPAGRALLYANRQRFVMLISELGRLLDWQVRLRSARISNRWRLVSAHRSDRTNLLVVDESGGCPSRGRLGHSAMSAQCPDHPRKVCLPLLGVSEIGYCDRELPNKRDCRDLKQSRSASAIGRPFTR